MIRLFIIFVLLFLAFPSLDLWSSHWFYDPVLGWFDGALVNTIYWVVPWFAAGLVLGLGAVWFGSWIGTKIFKPWRKSVGYLFLVFALGPGLVVNTLFKNHWGRARPLQVQEFSGSAVFSPAWIPTNQCNYNCSFVSGHAAVGFYLVAFGFLGKRRFWQTIGILAGTGIGLARIVQGGHFVSDVVFSFFTVYFVAWLVWKVLYPPEAAGVGRATATAVTKEEGEATPGR